MTASIVHVVRQYLPSIGGLEAVVSRLAHEQQVRGHRVRVVTLDRLFTQPAVRLPAREMVDGIEVVRLPWSGSSRYPLCPRVLGALDGADLVHVHGIDFFFDFLAATRLIHRRVLVASTHGGFFHTSYASRLKKIWFHTITRLSSFAYRRIAATSENDGRVFAAIAGPRVVVAENGVELDRFHDAGSTSRVRTLLYFGRWSSNKGLAELMPLLAALRAIEPAWRLVIAGRPYDLWPPDIERLARAHGVRDAIEIVEAPDDATLRSLMHRASYFACLSHHEGFGIAALEAMSAGLVPLLSDIPPFRKVVDESRSGLLLDRAAPAASAAAIERLHAADQHDDVERGRRMTFAARYDWSSVVDRYEAIYRDALQSSPAPVARIAS